MRNFLKVPYLTGRQPFHEHDNWAAAGGGEKASSSIGGMGTYGDRASVSLRREGDVGLAGGRGSLMRVGRKGGKRIKKKTARFMSAVGR